jgi:phage baseplate assembly protein W
MAIKLRKPIKIDPVDIDEKVAVGIRLPFNKKKIFDLDYTTRAHAKSKLINVLLTSPGERLHHPNFGAGLKNRLFQQNTPIAGEELREIVTPQVEQYVPEITIKNIALRDSGLQGHILNMTVNYSLNNNDEEDSVTLSFTNDNFNNEV